MNQQQSNLKANNKLIDTLTKVVKNINKNATVKPSRSFYCTVIQVEGNTYADVDWMQGAQTITLHHIVNKTGVIVNVGDKVLLTAPMGDLSDLYIDRNQNNAVQTDASTIVGILKIGGVNNSSGEIQIMDGNAVNPALDISGHSIDFYDSKQTAMSVGSIATDRTGDIAYLDILSELGCAFKVQLRNNDDSKTLYDAIVVNNQLSEGVRNIDMNIPINISPGGINVTAEFTPDEIRLFGLINFEGGSASNIGDLSCVNLSVSGTKNCKQTTKNFGDRLFYANESADNQLGDHGFGNILNGECLISIDPIILESVNTDMNYTVSCDFDEDCHYKLIKTPNYFTITADKNISFSWNMHGFRRGFENERLEYADNLKNDLIQPNERNILLEDIKNDTSDLLNNKLFKE